MLIKVFSKNIFYLLMFILFSYGAFAQLTSNGNFFPNPLNQFQSSFYPILKKPIKSFVYIIDKDTVSKSYYDKNGNEYSQLDYENNKPFYKSLFKYTGAFKTESKFFIKDILQSTTTFRYDEKGNLIEWQAVKTVYDTKTSTSKLVDDIHWKIEYDNTNKVKKESSLDASKTVNQFFEYSYNASNKLIEKNERQWKDTYEYNNNLLTNKYRIFKNDNSVYSSSEFKYNSNNLLIESSDKYYVTAYSYDSLQLKKIIYMNKLDKTNQEINFFYLTNIIFKVEINTTDIKLKPEFYFKTDYLYHSWSKTDRNKLKMEFLYDKYNNVIEIKYFIKDEYMYSKFFIYSYY